MTIWLGIVYAYKGLLMVGAERRRVRGTSLSGLSLLGAALNINTQSPLD